MSVRGAAFPAVSARPVNAAPLGVWSSWPSGWRRQRRDRAATKRPRNAEHCVFAPARLSPVHSSTAGLRGLVRDSDTQLGLGPCPRMELETRTSGRDCAETACGSSVHGESSTKPQTQVLWRVFGQGTGDRDLPGVDVVRGVEMAEAGL